MYHEPPFTPSVSEPCKPALKSSRERTSIELDPKKSWHWHVIPCGFIRVSRFKTEMELAAEITHVTNEINEVNAKINAIEVLLKKRY